MYDNYIQESSPSQQRINTGAISIDDDVHEICISLLKEEKEEQVLNLTKANMVSLFKFLFKYIIWVYNKK